MYTISRYIIFVPIVILILAVFVHYSSPNQSATMNTVIPTSQPQNIIPTKSSNAQLNLTGPFACNYEDKESNARGFIKNKKIYLELTQNNKTNDFLVNGDCGYKWAKGETNGEKMCGIGTYLSLYDTFSGMSFFNMDSIFSTISQFAPSFNIDSSKFTAMTQSCKKQTVEDTVFTVPNGIIFTDMQKITPSKSP